MDTQRLELRAIADDVIELANLMIVINGSETAGQMALALSSVMAFVAKESYDYLCQRGLLCDQSELFTSFHEAITELRVLLKLCDDRKSGCEGVAETLEMFQRKSAQWMNAHKTWWQRILAPWLQPDLGIFFIDENVLYLSIVSFSASSLARSEVGRLQDSDFARLPQNAFNFGQAIGAFLAQVIDRIARQLPLPAMTASYQLHLNARLTHNDFFANRIAAEVMRRFQLASKPEALLLLFVISQVNLAYLLLPQLLPERSNLLLRIQFVIAYHAMAAIGQLQSLANSPALSRVLAALQSLPAISNEREVRNLLAHYGFGKGKRYISTDQAPLDQMISGLTGQERSAIEQVALLRLAIISNWAQMYVSKPSLAKCRALLGDHT